MDSAEWLFWVAFHAVEPFGPRQEEVRAGVVGATAGSAFGARLKPADLFPSLKPVRTAAGERAAWAARCPALTPIYADR